MFVTSSIVLLQSRIQISFTRATLLLAYFSLPYLELVCGMELLTTLRFSVKGKRSLTVFKTRSISLNRFNLDINRASNLLYLRYNLKFVRKVSESERSESCTSEQTNLDSDSEKDDQEDFVEALESLDLNKPQNMQLYTNLLEPLVSQTVTEQEKQK